MSEQHKVYEVDLTELRPDPANANAGTERGQYMLETSVAETGLHRGVAVDANGFLVAGNKTHQAALDAGFKRAIVVETDGDTLVVTKRRDFDLTDEDPNNKARKAAYLDNRSSEVSLAWDADQILADIDRGLDLSSMFRDDELDRLLGEIVEQDAEKEWKGMPEFVTSAETTYQSLHVHFASAEAVRRFAELIGQTITEKTKFVWYPARERTFHSDKRWDDES